MFKEEVNIAVIPNFGFVLVVYFCFCSDMPLNTEQSQNPACSVPPTVGSWRSKRRGPAVCCSRCGPGRLASLLSVLSLSNGESENRAPHGGCDSVFVKCLQASQVLNRCQLLASFPRSFPEAWPTAMASVPPVGHAKCRSVIFA